MKTMKIEIYLDGDNDPVITLSTKHKSVWEQQKSIVIKKYWDRKTMADDIGDVIVYTASGKPSDKYLK